MIPFTPENMSTQKHKGGRPPKPEHLVADSIISVRVTKSDFEALKALEQLEQEAMNASGRSYTVNAAAVIRMLIRKAAMEHGIPLMDGTETTPKPKPSKPPRASKARKTTRPK
ncbi:MAG: hypothetical protein HY898_22800 [Deltaproteobacteria bacterium]|nr:hypothetical protein [Deltaproteobacteria bacterium]